MNVTTTILKRVLEGSWPTSYDPAFWVAMVVCVPLAADGSILVARSGPRLIPLRRRS